MLVVLVVIGDPELCRPIKLCQVERLANGVRHCDVGLSRVWTCLKGGKVCIASMRFLGQRRLDQGGDFFLPCVYLDRLADFDKG